MTGSKDFWSRRKAGVAREAERDEISQADAETAEAQAALEERPDEEILAELGLPDPDLMQRGDDFAAFMGRAVPERLRRRALRRLWRSDPVLANLDGLNNYDTDFTQSDIPGIAVTTAYQVGKGFARTVASVAEAEAPAADTPDAPQDEASTMLPGDAPEEEDAPEAAMPADDTPDGDTPANAAPVDETQAALTEGAPPDDGYVPGPRRRMRFEYTG